MNPANKPLLSRMEQTLLPSNPVFQKKNSVLYGIGCYYIYKLVISSSPRLAPTFRDIKRKLTIVRSFIRSIIILHVMAINLSGFSKALNYLKYYSTLLFINIESIKAYLLWIGFVIHL